MPKFKISALPDLTRKIHSSQNKWLNKNWQKTLSNHANEIEESIEKMNIINTWENKLYQEYDVAKKLIPEMFIDAFSSIHFACFGFYKYAQMCLRSELETALRLTFFSTHPIEFKWWLEGNKSYKSMLKLAKDVWGQGYSYFEQLENIRKFEEQCEDDKKLFLGKGNLKKTYETLSEFIHSGAGHLQTKPEKFSPAYDIDEFKKWHSRFKDIQTFINIMLTLGFTEEFKNMSNTTKNKILNKGIGDDYKDILKKVLN